MAQKYTATRISLMILTLILLSGTLSMLSSKKGEKEEMTAEDKNSHSQNSQKTNKMEKNELNHETKEKTGLTAQQKRNKFAENALSKSDALKLINEANPNNASSIYLRNTVKNDHNHNEKEK